MWRGKNCYFKTLIHEKKKILFHIITKKREKLVEEKKVTP